MLVKSHDFSVASQKGDNVFSNKEKFRECISITNRLLLAMTGGRLVFVVAHIEIRACHCEEEWNDDAAISRL